MATEKRLIDANELVPYLWALFKYFGSIPCTEADKATQRGIKRCIGEIKKMPTVDAVEVVHGRWHEVDGETEWDCHYRCSKCFTRSYELTNYCANCGAKMNGEAYDNA